MAFWILAVLLVVRMLAGGVAGWGAWALGGAVAERRTHRQQVAAE
jgi:hypothetical protein